MKKVLVVAAVAPALAAAAYGAWVYEGKWGKYGTGNGLFAYPNDAAVARNGRVYVADNENSRIQYFTATGSFLGKWGSQGRGNGQFVDAVGVAVAPGGNVYVADSYNQRIQYFTSSGSFLGKWGSYGSSKGQFWGPRGVAVAPNGNVYVTDAEYEYIFRTRVHYFTSSGSFLGKGGSRGSGNGLIYRPYGVAFAPASRYGYVADTWNYRIQYFRWSDPAVFPESLGKVKALFR